MFAMYATGIVESPLICGFVISIIMIVSGLLSEKEACDAVKLDEYLTVSAAFGTATVMANSGVADAMARLLVLIGDAFSVGDAGLFGAVYLVTFLISIVVTNSAAAAFTFPVAMHAASRAGVDPVLMCYCVMLGASASFMSPFGYTTNLLIYGPGGYQTKDFLRFGTPLQIMLWILTTAYLSAIRPWYLSWLGTAFVFFSAITVRVSNASWRMASSSRKARSP